MITLYHNPRCSKSREALAVLQTIADERELSLEVVDYLETPLNLAQLQALHAQIGGSVQAMIRENEAEYASLNLAQADDAALLEAIAAHPKLLQRPIVQLGERAVVGRPIERIDCLF